MNENGSDCGDTITTLCKRFKENNHTEENLYTKYDIKKGLRNADGTGVLAGITNISNVHGYLLDEGKRQPSHGVLTYRGYDIYHLVEGFRNEHRFGFEEISYLLLTGYLPDRNSLDDYIEYLGKRRNLPWNFTEDVIMHAPSRDIMNKLAGATLSLYSYDNNADEVTPENVMRQSIELIAKFPVIISQAYQAYKRYYQSKSMYLHVPDSHKSTAENILTLIRPDGVFTEEEAFMLDLCLCVHAEHGAGNNSAFATRVVSSSGTDTYSSIAASVGALKGPRHGGANLKVQAMIDDLRRSVDDIADENKVYEYLCKILRKEVGDKSGLIYGMGHAIYMISDPRATILKDSARHLANIKAMTDDFRLIEMIEVLAPKAFYNVRGEKKFMCANVDLYSGFIYKMLNIPKQLYTPLFASARIVGWCAHRLEEISISSRIIRPAYRSSASTPAYVALKERGEQ